LPNQVPETSATEATERWRIGALIPATVRGKLFFVFTVIIVSAAIGAVVAQRANVHVQTQLSLITEGNLPSLVTAHKISEATTNIKNVAAAMATSDDEATLARRRALLEWHIDIARSVVAALGKNRIDPGMAANLERSTAQLEDLTAQLASTVSSRLKLADELKNKVQNLSREHQKFNDAIRPLITKELTFLDSTSERVIGNTSDAVDRLNNISFNGLIPVLSISAQVANMKAALRKGSTATTEQQVDAAWGDFVAASSVTSRNIDTLGGSPAVKAVVDVDQLADRFKRLLAFGVGKTSVFELRRREISGKASTGALSNEELETAFQEFERLLRLSITLIRGATVTVGIDLNEEISRSLAAMNKVSVDSYGGLLGLEALGNRVVGILTVATFAGNLNDLEPPRLELQAMNREFMSVFERMSGSDDLADTLGVAQRLMGFGQGERSLLELRGNELRALIEVNDLLSRTNALTERMTVIAADMVTTAQVRAESAAAAVVASLRSSRVTLSLAMGLSFLAIFGALVYVNRSLGSRLGAFSNAALALAEGNLNVSLPEPAGQDEIARLMRALVVFRDTAAKMEESNLREIALMRQRLIDAVESISEGFAFFDPEERLVIANSRYRDVFLRDVRDLIVPGATFEAIVRAALACGLVANRTQDPEEWLAWRIRGFRQARGPFTLEYADGTFVQINERRTGDGGTVVIYTDITELKQRELQLMNAKEEAEAANEAKSNFLANVSHELRTPLTSILGFARIVQKRFQSTVVPHLVPAEGPVARAIRQIENNLEIVLLEGDRLTKLVNDVLDLEKIEAGEMVWNITALDIAAVIAQAAAATESLYRQKGLDFVTEIAPDLPQVLGDRDRVIQVLINLISNAVKFTEAGRITCRAAVGAEGRVEVAVADSGRGIALEDQAAIFEKFRQVGDTLTEKPSGTGLGLPICREIIEHLGGEIAVESNLRRGSTFSFWLPAARCDQSAADAG
jgi:signal transduction histidine kinase/HAMP domain-containing protein